MRRKLVAANWKMNGDTALVSGLLSGFLEAELGAKCDVAIFAPTIFLPQVAATLKESKIRWGGQNSAAYLKGAYTGETSSVMLKECGCQYVLVGHSERRALFGDTNEICGVKTELALSEGLIPVVCVGETLEQREANQTMAIVREQLRAVIDQVGIDALASCVIAYEPVWAIGTGVTASPDQAQAVHADIRAYVAEQRASVAEKIQILYGGSVTAGTAQELFGMPDVDGGLVGGASLKLSEFVTICHSAE